MLLNSEISGVLLANKNKSSEDLLEICVKLVKGAFKEKLNEQQNLRLIEKLQTFKSHFNAKWKKSSRILCKFQEKNELWLKLPFTVNEIFDLKPQVLNEVVSLKRGRQSLQFDHKGMHFKAF